MKPEDYKDQDCCATCKHVFDRYDYEEDSEYFCHFDKTERPRCGSVRLDEDFRYFNLYRDARRRKARVLAKAWYAWSEPRSVKAWGHCSKYEKIEEE